MKKRTPEEERLSTCARLHAEHPDNEVAWAELRKAALRLGAAVAGLTLKGKREKLTEAEIARIRKERAERVADHQRRRREWEATQRRGGR